MDSTDILELAAERAVIGRRRVDWHRIVVRTETDTVEHTVEVPLTRAEVQVTRVPMDRVVDSVPPVRTEGCVTILPVVEERLVRQLVLVEEIHLHRREVTEVARESIPLRRQRAVVEQIAVDPGSEVSHDFSHEETRS